MSACGDPFIVRSIRIVMTNIALMAALASSVFAQNAMNCSRQYNGLDEVISANLDKFHKDVADVSAFASVNRYMSGLLAKEPRRDRIDGAFAQRSEAWNLGMTCQIQPSLKHRCTYIFGPKIWLNSREFVSWDVWLFQFDVTAKRHHASAALIRADRLGGSTAPTTCK